MAAHCGRQCFSFIEITLLNYARAGLQAHDCAVAARGASLCWESQTASQPAIRLRLQRCGGGASFVLGIIFRLRFCVPNGGSRDANSGRQQWRLFQKQRHQGKAFQSLREVPSLDLATSLVLTIGNAFALCSAKSPAARTAALYRLLKHRSGRKRSSLNAAIPGQGVTEALVSPPRRAGSPPLRLSQEGQGD